MERPRPNIISFISKQLKYKTLPPDVLADVCLVAYSTSDIVNTRNIVIDAFEENIDYTLPRTTTTTDIRGDLLRIFDYLKRFPCAVGQEQKYTEHIEKRALVARLNGMSQIVTGLCNMLKKSEESMPTRDLQPGQCSNAADTGDHEFERQHNPLVQIERMPMNQDMNMQEPAVPIFPAYAENREEFFQFPIEDIHDEPDQVGAEMQVLSVNPPTPILDPEEEVSVNAPLPNQGQDGLRGNPIQLMVSTRNEDARVSSLMVEWVGRRHVHLSAVRMPIVQEPTDQAPATSEPRVDAPAAPGPKVQDDSCNDPVEDDLSSLSSLTSASSVSITSEEDLLPLSMLKAGTRTATVQVEVQVQLPRPIAPPAQRFQFEGLPEPSQPILIPTPIRLVTDWLSDEELPTSNPDSRSVPPCSKRPRRMDHPE